MVNMNMKSGLVSLIGRRSFLSKAYYYATSRHIIKSTTNAYGGLFQAIPLIHSCRSTRNGEIPKTIHYKVEEEEAKGKSCFDPLFNKPTYFRKGDVINLVELLFTKDRDYLIKCNNGQRVKAEQLAGKVVIIYLDSISAIYMKCMMTTLMRVYNDLQPNNCLEVVFVDGDVDSNPADQRDPCKYFNDIFTHMPWTAIPLSDITLRKNLKQKFGAYGTFVVDSSGKIVQEGQYIISRYGALGYPFTDERINFLCSEDDAVARKPSLKKLLASPECDYLITNKQDKVPIHTLVDKVVALYFYEEGVTSDYTTLEIKMAYEELTKNKENFEVVLIYVYDTAGTCYTNEESFWKKFKTMPWLALPLRDSNYKKLKRIFDYDNYGCYHDNLSDYYNMNPKFVIIGPNFKFFEPFAHKILSYHNISAFPFSREKVTKLFAKRAKELKLDMLWDQKSVFGGEVGSRVQFCQVVGKKVIVLFEWGLGSCSSYVEFLDNLKEKYIQLKDTDDEFEVIHIIDAECNEDTYNKHYANHPLPWSVHPLVDGGSLAEALFLDFNILYDSWNGDCELIAFDSDGNLVRMTSDPTFEDTGFPFYAGGLEKEVLPQIVTAYNLDLHDRSPAGMIYSYNRNCEDVFA